MEDIAVPRTTLYQTIRKHHIEFILRPLTIVASSLLQGHKIVRCTVGDVKCVQYMP